MSTIVVLTLDFERMSLLYSVMAFVYVLALCLPQARVSCR